MWSFLAIVWVTFTKNESAKLFERFLLKNEMTHMLPVFKE